MTKRFLLVGSLLRPANLLEYKRAIEKRDDITYPFYDDFDGYKETEAAAVKEVVQKQVDRQIPEITEGEFARSLWHLDFVWGLKGIRRYIREEGYQFKDKDEEGVFETRRDIGLEITGPLSGKNHQFIKQFKTLKELAPDNLGIKQTIPAPAHIYGEFIFNESNAGKIYANDEDLRQGLIKAYKEFVKEYAEAGGKILQMDDCLWELFAEDSDGGPFGGNTSDNLALAQTFVDTNNAIIDYAHELGLKVYGHNCRGNYQSRGFSSGSYEAIAHLFLEKQHYDRFYLEWDDERAGSFKALKAFENKPETEIVIGLLSSKTRELDDEERILEKLDEVTQYIPKDKLYLSHQCGFASCDNGNELSEEEQWAKIEQGQAIAEKYWGE